MAQGQRVIVMGGVAGLLAWILSAASRKGGGTPSSPGEWQPPNQHGAARIRELCSLAGIDERWSQFLVFVAYGESHWNNLVGLGEPSLFPEWTRPNLKASPEARAAEAKAARVAYERNAERFVSCGIPQQAYVFGSGGWFGILPANGLAKLDGTPLVCMPPSSVFDPSMSVTMAIAMARALMGWTGFQQAPTWLTLRIGWGNPSGMGDPVWTAAKRDKFERHRKACNLPSGWLDELVGPRPPNNYAEMYERMRSGAVV